MSPIEDHLLVNNGPKKAGRSEALGLMTQPGGGLSDLRGEPANFSLSLSIDLAVEAGELLLVAMLHGIDRSE